MGRELADNITMTIRQKVEAINNQSGLVLGDEDYVDPESISVWTYAIYYPYYEQYITLGWQALIQLGICFIPGTDSQAFCPVGLFLVFLFTFILLGFDVISGLIVLVTVGLIVIDTYGFCVLWDVDMNALTLIITGSKYI